MSTSSSKKEKRHSLSGETNKSFVKKVTSRVSGLLPATITKWFSSPSSSNTNGSAQVADATDSSTDDEAPDSPVTLQPPAKRMRYTSPGNFNQFAQVETKCIGTNTETLDDTSYMSQQPMERSNFKTVQYLASSCSPVTSNVTVDTTIQNSFFKSSAGHVDKKRKSIFDNTDVTMKPNPTPVNTRNPYFKPSLLSSPFYVGRTTYGGAASSYMSQANVKQRKISLTNEASNNSSVAISHSARRVMDLLENYSSPLVEAKRIPPVVTSPDKRQKPINPYGSKTFSYKTQELYVPTVASILTIKRKSRLMDTTNAARQIMASHSSTSEFQPYPKTNPERNPVKEGDKLTTKVKTKLTRSNRKQNIDEESNVTDNIHLPNVVLQIDKDNLPKFTFSPLPTSSSSSLKQTPKIIVTPDYDKTATKTTESNIEKSAKDKDEDFYKFSIPVTISNEAAKTSLALPKYCFGSPERNIDKVQDVKETNIKMDTNTSSKTLTEKGLPTLKSSVWKCLDCWVQNRIDVNNCVCCDGKKPIEIEDTPKKCSSCYVILSQSENTKCSECTKKINNTHNPIEKVNEIKVSKWKCNDCWVDNDESAEKCVCCGGKNPKKIPPCKMNTEKMVESDWKCNECWIKNKGTLEKCAACCAKKPSSPISTYSLTKGKDIHMEVKGTSNSTFENIAKSQREKWECPLCLVRNDSNRATCICCEADRPGTIKESHKKIFNFHQPSDITFKFGIELKKQEEAKKQESIENSNLVEKSETNNNILPKTPTFSFGVSKKIEEQPETLTHKSEGAPKINFTFGIQKSELVTPIFGIPNNIPVTPKTAEDKPQEVPQVLTAPEPKTPVDLFKTPLSQNSFEIPAIAPIQSSSNQATSTSKESSFFNTPALSTANSDVQKQQNNFTFSTIKPATNLFGTTTTTTVASSVSELLSSNTSGPSTLPLFQKPDVIKTTTVSFFQKSDPVTTTATTISLFSKVEATTSSGAPLSVTPPIFSFGSSAAVPQAEKPKFQFSFGNTKTDSPTLFKPTFGVTTDNNISTNKFNIPSNTIAGGNVLSGNPLNNTTPMNPANALTTGNSLTNTPTPSLFGTAVQKENMWAASNNNMLFVSNTNTNTVQKPPTFTFGAATPFNATNSTFGSTTQPAQTVFGISTTANQPMFGNQMNNQINSQMNSQTNNIFGSTQPTNNSMPMGMFGSPNAGASPAFGTPNTSMPTFEAPSLSPAPTPTFNFGSQQPSGIFGFGQPQQSQAPQIEGQAPQPGMYNFATPGGAPQQLQFNMGSAPNTGRRVIRKAMRRTQR